jgi:multicomponent Na+:H+ antiporter subunit A
MEATSDRMGPLVHNGLVRTYVVWALAAASVLVLAGYAATNLAVPAFDGLGVPIIVALVLLIATLAGFAVPTAPSHVAGVLTLSILGFMLAIFYIVASAPDLALTQLVVETLVLLIFLLVLQRLPEFYTDIDRFVAARDVGLSLLVGAAAFASTLLVSPSPSAEPSTLARAYSEMAVPEGGGTNVVNVILVDFRGFDTLGELVVVTIAAMSVLVLVTMRTRGEAQ